MGEEDRTALKKIQKLALTHALIYTSIIAVLLFIFADPLSNFFFKSVDSEAVRLGIQCIRISCFSLVFHSIVYNFNSYLMPIKRIKFCSLYSFLIECGCLVPITFLMLKLIGYQGAWYAKIISMAAVSLLAVIYICCCGKGNRFSDKMLLLPESFGIPPEDELGAEYSSPEEIRELSKIAGTFALEHKAEKEHAVQFSLVVEKLAQVLFDYGLSDGKEHHINTRFVSKDGDLIVRMRDDCKLFNMAEYEQILQDRNETEMSPAVILSTAKEFQYSSTFGVNTIIVRL